MCYNIIVIYGYNIWAEQTGNIRVTLPYSGKLSREKLLRMVENEKFAEKTFVDR